MSEKPKTFWMQVGNNNKAETFYKTYWNTNLIPEDTLVRPMVERKYLTTLEKKLEIAKAALEEIANEDFRGNRPSGSIKAFEALEEISK